MRSLEFAPQAGQFSQLEVDLLPLAPHSYAALPGTGPRTSASGGTDARRLPLASRDSSEWPVSNRRPLGPKPSALPTELRSVAPAIPGRPGQVKAGHHGPAFARPVASLRSAPEAGVTADCRGPRSRTGCLLLPKQAD